MVEQCMWRALSFGIVATIFSTLFEGWPRFSYIIWLQLLSIFLVWFSASFISGLFVAFLKLKWENRKNRKE